MNDSEREWANQLNHDTHTKIYGSPGVTGNIASQGIWHLHTNRILPLELILLIESLELLQHAYV